MTLARDPLVVVEALRKALKGWTDYFDRLQQDALLADPNDPLIAMRDKLHGKRMNDSFDALALSAPMPAPETKPPVALCGCVAGGNKCHYHNKHPQLPVVPAPERPSVEEVMDDLMTLAREYGNRRVDRVKANERGEYDLSDGGAGALDKAVDEAREELRSALRRAIGGGE